MHACKRRSGVATLATAALVAALASPANGYSPPELSWANCSGNIAALTTVLEVRAMPQQDANVTAGDSVRFSAPSELPLTFAVASSPALLANPNIDQGLGQPSQPEHMQLFTSLKAAATAGTVYWQVSFEAAEVPECAGVSSGLISIPPRTLVVGPALVPAPVLVPAPLLVPQEKTPTPPAADFSAAIRPSSVNTHHPTVAFRVRCTASCVGTVNYVPIATRSRRSIGVPALSFGPHRISISSSSGGMESFSHRYTGVALREIESLLKDHHALAFRISASLTDASGNTAVAHATAQLRD
jgi:hypothetical protein